MWVISRGGTITGVGLRDSGEDTRGEGGASTGGGPKSDWEGSGGGGGIIEGAGGGDGGVDGSGKDSSGRVKKEIDSAVVEEELEEEWG
jgi:hypothetical protein